MRLTILPILGVLLFGLAACSGASRTTTAPPANTVGEAAPLDLPVNIDVETTASVQHHDDIIFPLLHVCIKLFRLKQSD